MTPEPILPTYPLSICWAFSWGLVWKYLRFAWVGYVDGNRPHPCGTLKTPGLLWKARRRHQECPLKNAVARLVASSNVTWCENEVLVRQKKSRVKVKNSVKEFVHDLGYLVFTVFYKVWLSYDEVRYPSSIIKPVFVRWNVSGINRNRRHRGGFKPWISSLTAHKSHRGIFETPFLTRKCTVPVMKKMAQSYVFNIWTGTGSMYILCICLYHKESIKCG